MLFIGMKGVVDTHALQHADMRLICVEKRIRKEMVTMI